MNARASSVAVSRARVVTRPYVRLLAFRSNVNPQSHLAYVLICSGLF